VPTGTFNDPGGDRPAAGQRGGIVQVGDLGVKVTGAGVSAFAFGLAVAGGGGAAADPAATCAALPSRIAVARPATQFAASGSPGSKNVQAAFHTYSITCMKSMRIVTAMPRSAACAVTASIWVLFPSSSAIQVRSRPGSRRPASSKAAAMTARMSSVTEAVATFPVPSAGPRGPRRARR
jgi:hypothetical protein